MNAIARAAYDEAMAIPVIRKRRPKGSVLAVAMRHGVVPEHLSPSSCSPYPSSLSDS